MLRGLALRKRLGCRLLGWCKRWACASWRCICSTSADMAPTTVKRRGVCRPKSRSMVDSALPDRMAWAMRCDANGAKSFWWAGCTRVKAYTSCCRSSRDAADDVRISYVAPRCWTVRSRHASSAGIEDAWRERRDSSLTSCQAHGRLWLVNSTSRHMRLEILGVKRAAPRGTASDGQLNF